MAAHDPSQVWDLRVDGRAHRVEVHGSVSRRISWLVDGAEVGATKSSDNRVTVTTEEPDLGKVRLRFGGGGRPRRATLVRPGHEDLDLVPAPGSPAAAHEERVRAHPTRYALLQTVVGVVTVVGPILVTVLLARLALSLPLPDVPLPDLPDLPSPDLPSLPRPDLPDVSLPGWLRAVLDKAGYVWPVLLAVVLARGEVRRRRRQDELRRQHQGDEQD